MANAPAFRGVRHTFGAHYQIFITVAILLMWNVLSYKSMVR
jgi:hypothetical protein